jgi:hypothetical protein
MSSVMGMAVLLGIIALLLVGGFLFAWKGDKNRSDDVSDETERLDT